MSSRIIALHGFLGHPADFKPLKLDYLFAPSLFRFPISPFGGWARRFNRGINAGSILLGYSMGGRLALHCALSQKEKYRAMIILAAHPGIADKKERQKRFFNDLTWAQKFETFELNDVVKEWNTLPIFKTSIPIPRYQQDFNGRILARSLRYFSLGQQEFLPPLINELNLPILWLFPREEAEKIQALSLQHRRSRLIPMDGGHRFMFLYPQKTSMFIKDWINTL